MRTLLLLLLLAVPADAQEVIDVLFETDPPGAGVYLVTSDPQPQLLGVSGEPFAMRKPREPFRLEFRKNLYQNRPVGDVRLARRGELFVYPKDGPLRLVPTHPLVPLLRPVPLTLISLVSLGLVVGLLNRTKSRRERQEIAAFEARVAPSEDATVGTWINDYLVLDKLGRGGMAVVYRVTRRSRPDDEYALKLLNEDCCEDDEFIERFRREVKICRALQHPAIVQLYDFDTWNHRYYTVMELLSGHTLREEVSSHGLPPAAVLKLLKPVFEGVAFAHAQGVVHRDLKPENVLVTLPGQVIKVADFGLARRENSTTITRTGSVFGTPAYMSPEQISEGPMTPAVDQYALGVMAYEMLAGRPPFLSQNNPVETIMKHLTEPPPPVTDFRSDLSAEVNDVLHRMLAKDPQERYPSIMAAYDALREALG